jgi:endogenous inhibitor of DNA gyrase (YacG/DUF329 family)
MSHHACGVRILPEAAGGPAWRPFCSERCRFQDLARWLDGGYTIPGDVVPGRWGSESEDPEGKGQRSIQRSFPFAFSFTFTCAFAFYA